MTIKELKEKIKNLPDTMDVYIEQTNDEYPYSYALTSEVVELAYKEEDSGEIAIEKILVISDD